MNRLNFRFAGLIWLFLAVVTALAQGRTQPLWTVNVQEKLALRSFESELTLTWSKQQGVVYPSPERVVIYQVNQLLEPAHLAGRSSNGGGGNFFLDVRILDVRDGRTVKTLRLPTSASFSKIIPTHDGRMVVRTGDSIFLCTEDFQPLASRTLPIKGEAPIESWQIGVSPSGRQVVLVHQQIKPSPLSLEQNNNSWALTEIEILDADTLKTGKTFSVPHGLSSWSAGEGVLVTANPVPASGEPRFGLLDFGGNWTALEFKNDHCAYRMDAFGQGYIAGYGCGRIVVLGAHAERVFSHQVGGRSSIGSLDLAGRYLAVELVRQIHSTLPGTNFPVMVPKSERLEVYDLIGNKRLFSLPARSENVYYEISAGGLLAVVDGASMALYRMGETD